jgi:nitrite reductase (NADH) large subunit
VVDDLDKRRALAARFVFSQRFSQKDPWAERVAGKDAHEFAPIADLSSLAGQPA